MLLRASRRSRSAFFCSMASMLFLLLVVVGCGGGEGGQDQQDQDQSSEETTTQEAAQETTTQETTIQGEVTTEEPAPVTKITADRQYVGRVEGTDAFIGIAVRDQTGELIAYVCDGPPQGPPEAATIEAWFQGPIQEGDQASLISEGGMQQLQVTLTPAEATGTFTDVDRRIYTFVAEPVAQEAEAGLYWTEPLEGEGLSARGGTIILPDGEERGARKPRPRPKGGPKITTDTVSPSQQAGV